MTEDHDAIELSPEAADLVTAHCAQTGLTRAAAIDDLLQRGAQRLELARLREAVEDIRATVVDTLQALDAMAPYAIAGLSLLAHWATRTGTTRLGEVEYAEAARDAGRATWDGHLAARGVPLPSRPASEQASVDAVPVAE